MKVVKLEVFTGKTQFTKKLTFDGRNGINKIVGTCISDLFEFNSRLRKYGNSYVKANEAVSIVLSTEEAVLLDSYTLNSEYGFTLKFGNTAKSKRKFASCLNDLMTWAAQEVKLVTLEELIETLKDEE